MTAGISVLCVDDDPDIRSVTAAALERTAAEFEVSTASCGRDALSRLEGRACGGTNGAIDCIVSDYDMPGMDGLELLEAVRERDPEIPFILFTGKGSEEIASEAISAGVTDYLQKGTGSDQYAVLANRIENAVEKRRADRARRESERELRQYRTLVESVDDPMYVLDERGRCVIANDAFCTFLGVEKDGLLGEHVSNFISRESFERGVKTVRQLYTGAQESGRVVFTAETDDGRRIGEANLTALTDDDGAFAGSTAVIRDITDRKRRERELAQYERIIELAPIALFLLDEEATITWCNDEFAAPFTEEIDELIGTPFPTLVERGYYDERVTTKYTDNVRELLSSSNDLERAEYRVRFRSPEGEERIHDVHTRLLPLEDGEFTGTIHAIRDITQRRRYQRELERQNERLEEFASVVSHDLRNPLNVAQGTLELHAEECPAADDGDDSLERVRWSLERMDELVDHLLSLARHGRTVGDPEPVELSTVVREAWAAVETGGATLDCRVDLTIAADEGRLQALLENLFRNSVEHGSTSSRPAADDAVEHGSTSSPSQAQENTGRRAASSEPSVADAPENAVEHGSTSPDSEGHQADASTAAGFSATGALETGADLTVTVGPLESDADDAGDGRPGTGFYVADDGPGFESPIEDLFEFGHTTVEDGTGFGLSIVEGIAEAHDWSITARNGDNGGARFEITGVTVLDDRSTRD